MSNVSTYESNSHKTFIDPTRTVKATFTLMGINSPYWYSATFLVSSKDGSPLYKFGVNIADFTGNCGIKSLYNGKSDHALHQVYQKEIMFLIENFIYKNLGSGVIVCSDVPNGRYERYYLFDPTKWSTSGLLWNTNYERSHTIRIFWREIDVTKHPMSLFQNNPSF